VPPDATPPPAHFRTLAELASARHEDPAYWQASIDAGRLPQPSYVRDGVGWFPPTYLTLVDEAGGVDRLRAHFEERFCLAADATGALAGPDELDEAWDEYLSGAWGRLLVDPTPEHAVQANRLAGSIAELLAAPAPDDPHWARRLGARTGALATLLREGCADDRSNDEEHPWDLWVAVPRRDYADVIAHPDARRGGGAPDP